LRKLFVGLPSAKFFRPVLRDRVFQQPQALALIEIRGRGGGMVK
jgi:hypothetical protein